MASIVAGCRAGFVFGGPVSSLWFRYPGAACSGLVGGTGLSVNCKGLEWVGFPKSNCWITLSSSVT